MPNEFLKQVLEKILVNHKIDTKETSVLDIGCSDIRPYSQFLISTFKKYEGIDVNQKFVNDAQKKIGNDSNATVLTGNVERLDYKDKLFDVVVCNNVLAYTNKKKALQEILRVLKNGGVCISLYNNTIDYSLLKIIKKQTKPVLSEVIHSFAVIINTFIYKLAGGKFFHTTFNTEKELKDLLKKCNINAVFIEKQKIPYDFFSISVINFMFRKEKYDQ